MPGADWPSFKNRSKYAAEVSHFLVALANTGKEPTNPPLGILVKSEGPVNAWTAGDHFGRCEELGRLDQISEDASKARWIYQ